MPTETPSARTEPASGAPAGQHPTGHLVRPAGGGYRALLTYSVIADRRYLKVSLLSQLLAPIAYLLALGWAGWSTTTGAPATWAPVT